MKKIIASVVVIAMGFASVSAMACPKGLALVGGVGKHHKGAKCRANVAAPASTSTVRK